jgi:polyhydroxyalkanoate synthesis regulator phasin
MDILKKTLVTGIGLAYLTKEKVEELAKEMIEEGKLAAGESKQFIDDLLKKSTETKDKIKEELDQTVQASLKKMDLVSKKDYEALEARLHTLEQELKNKKKA